MAVPPLYHPCQVRLGHGDHREAGDHRAHPEARVHREIKARKEIKEHRAPQEPLEIKALEIKAADTQDRRAVGGLPDKLAPPLPPLLMLSLSLPPLSLSPLSLPPLSLPLLPPLRLPSQRGRMLARET